MDLDAPPRRDAAETSGKSEPASEGLVQSRAEASSSSEDATRSQEAPKVARGVLKKYIEGFDQQTLVQMAQLVTLEGGALVELQTQALFGDLPALQKQMQVESASPVFLSRQALGIKCLFLHRISVKRAPVALPWPPWSWALL